MRVRLVFLGRLQDLAGGAERAVEAAPGATVATLIAGLGQELAEALDSPRVRVAVNGVLVGVDRALVEADEVAFLPPVSGG